VLNQALSLLSNSRLLHIPNCLPSLNIASTARTLPSLSIEFRTPSRRSNLTRSANSLPFRFIRLIVFRVCRDLYGLIFNLFRQDQIQDETQESSYGEPSLHNELNGVEEAHKSGIVAFVGEYVAEPSWDQCGTKTQRHRRSQNEAVPASERDCADNSDTGHGDRRKEEGCHPAQHAARNCNQRRRKLGENAHDDEEEAATVTGLAIGALGEGDDAVVLSER
jgi:hypothetical protein